MSSSNEHEAVIDLEKITKKSAHVEKVHIHGINLTNDWFIKQQVSELFQAKQVHTLLLLSAQVKQRLVNLGIFNEVTCSVDTYKGPEFTGSVNVAWAQAIQQDRFCVSYSVKEKRRLCTFLNTDCHNENDLRLQVGMSAPNLLGRAIHCQALYQLGMGFVSSKSFTFEAPLVASTPTWKLGFGVFENHNDLHWARVWDQTAGYYGEMKFQSLLGKHSLKLQSLGRNIGSFNADIPSEVRQSCGVSQKQSLLHVLEHDSRDACVFPLQGTLLRSATELVAGATLSTVQFVKNEWKASTNLPLTPLLSAKCIERWGLALQASLGLGYILKVAPSSEVVNVADRFYLGGALTLRGFEHRSVGARSADQGNSAALGNLAYYVTGLHLYSALPWIGRDNQLTDAIRLHAFVNAGNAQPTAQQLVTNQCWLQQMRAAAGLGVVLRLAGVGRVEMHYCIPLSSQPRDRVTHGFQLGFGVDYF